MVQDYIEKLKNNFFALPLFIFYPIWLMISKNSKQGAQTTIYCSVLDFDDLKKFNGSYFRFDITLNDLITVKLAFFWR